MGGQSSKVACSDVDENFVNLSSTQIDSNYRQLHPVSRRNLRKNPKKKSKKPRNPSSFKIHLRKAKLQILQQLKESKRIAKKRYNLKVAVKRSDSPVVQDEIQAPETHISDGEELDISDGEQNAADTAFIMTDEEEEITAATSPTTFTDDHAASKRNSAQNGNPGINVLLSQEDVGSICITNGENSLRQSLSESEKSKIIGADKPINHSQKIDAERPFSAKRKRESEYYDLDGSPSSKVDIFVSPRVSTAELSSGEIQDISTKPVLVVQPIRQIKSILKKSRDDTYNSQRSIMGQTTAMGNSTESANFNRSVSNPDVSIFSSHNRVVTIALPEDVSSEKSNIRIEETKSQKPIRPLKSILKKPNYESQFHSRSHHDEEVPGTSNASTRRLGCFSVCQSEPDELSPLYKKRIVNVSHPEKESNTEGTKKMDGNNKTKVQQAEVTCRRKSSRKIKPVKRFNFS